MPDYGSDYYESNEQSGDRPALKFYYELFKREMGKQNAQARVLEYGCGLGYLTQRLTKKFKCYALDISDYALSQVEKNAPEATTIKSLGKIKRESLDGIIALHVMEHIKDPLVTFKQFNDKLKKDGLLFYVVPNPNGMGHKIKKEKWFAYSDPTHISLFDQKKWIRLTKKAGFSITKVKGDGLWDVPYLPVLPLLVQKLIFYPLAALQVIPARIFLPTKLGECLIVVARKR